MNIEGFCREHNLGEVIKVNKLTGGLMHKMYKVETDDKIYAIKVLNPEVMKREGVLDNFMVSEKISNLAFESGIPVSCALKINDSFITKYEDSYYMVFDYIDGHTLSDDEISIEHCRKIGRLLASIHKLDYKKLGLKAEINEEHFYVEWKDFINNDNFKNMSYKELYLDNYLKYYSILKRSVQRFNESNKSLAICHTDMDPKNVMWRDDEPIVIDWESASVKNPYRELIEEALCWSGFLSDNFQKEKFAAVIEEYLKDNKIDADVYSLICGNMIGRFGWLDYNLKRSLGIKSNDKEEMILASEEVTKTINEINRYLDLIGTMNTIVCNLINMDDSTSDPYIISGECILKIIDSNKLFQGKEYKKINAGFTNTIYQVGEYIVRICSDISNEERFKKEIEFYEKYRNDNTPKIYFSDITKEIVPYYYEVIEKINGVTLYEVWYKISFIEREKIVKDIINILKKIHLLDITELDNENINFKEWIKEQLISNIRKCDINNEYINKLVDKCDIYFKDNKFGLIHNDLHFDNFIYNEDKISLIDFERWMIGPIDYDFKIINRYDETPWLWASFDTDMKTVEDDYKNIMDLFMANYEELSNIPYLKERLIVYKVIEYLKQYSKSKDVNMLKRIVSIVKDIIDR